MPAPFRPSVRPVVLVILDGFGCRDAAPDNAIARARKPNLDRLFASCPHTSIDASEFAVGLPRGQMGNSEVGHLNIGAGRVVYQDYTRIDQAIESGEFARNAALCGAVSAARDRDRTVHILGLASPGGVHSHERHIAAMIDLAASGGAPDICVHAFLDGRDTPPRSAEASLAYLERACGRAPRARIASIVGRYYAMDRDKRWERVIQAYDLLVDGIAQYSADTPREGLSAAYARGETDEFVSATTIVVPGTSPARVNDGDAIVFMNFRADRARQLTCALTDAAFDGFPRRRVPKLGAVACLTSYGDDFSSLPAAFPPQSVANGFGEHVASLGLAQLRIAETEKYAHVTYFFSGGIETPYLAEDRVLVPSPKVATYDQKPEMSAFEVTDRLVAAIESRRYDTIICNYANADMVGHTGNLDAATRAIEALDTCVGRVATALRDAGGELLITSDHGNAEKMHDEDSDQPHTAHTLNVVPCLYMGRHAHMASGGSLRDVAPTLLAMLGAPIPSEMTGRSLVTFD